MDCSNLSDISSKYNISQECALFDFLLYTVTVGLVCLLGVLGNALSFVVLTRDAHRSATSFLLRALAVADTLVLMTAVPLYVLPPIHPYSGYLSDYYHLYLRVMPLLWPIYLVPHTASILLTVIVSLDRYVAVCRPFNAARFFSPTRVRRLVLLVSAFSLLYNIPRFFEYEMAEVCVARNESRTGFEISAFGDNRLYRILYANIAYFALMHGGPLLCLAFLNSRLVMALRSRQQRKRKITSVSKPTRESRDITLVLIVVIFVFMFCQTPTLIDHVLWTAVTGDQRHCGHWHYYYTAVADALAILNSSVNFVIYFLTSRKFRRSLVVCGSGGARQPSTSGRWTVSHVDGRRATRAAISVTNSAGGQILLAGTCAALAPTSCTVTADGRIVTVGLERKEEILNTCLFYNCAS